MSQSLLYAFIIFALVMFFTPGPNNIMLLSSGLTYGFRRTIPHIAGITIGFAFMVGAVGLGLGTVFLAYPILQTILKYAGAAYLIYLAAVIAFSGAAKPGEGSARGPMTFWGAAMFQWINAKGWVIVIGTITAYAAIAQFPLNIAIQTLIRPARGHGLDRGLGLFRHGIAAGPDLRAAGPRLQYPDGDPAVDVSLPRFHGCMMSRISMQNRVSQWAENALDSLRNPQISASRT
ncbi:threonine/homoserine/homoserine lactone efflux protein [Bradyrhizobium sp. LM6.11]